MDLFFYVLANGKVSERMLQFGLKYWLEQGALCRQVFLDFVNSFGIDLPSMTKIKVGGLGVSAARPDLSIYGESGGLKVIIETKIDAPFTAQQPAGYFDLLAPGEPGMVMVVAPQSRMDELWDEATSRLLPRGLELVSQERRGCRVAKIGLAEQHFALVSWDWLILSAYQCIKDSREVENPRPFGVDRTHLDGSVNSDFVMLLQLAGAI